MELTGCGVYWIWREATEPGVPEKLRMWSSKSFSLSIWWMTSRRLRGAEVGPFFSGLIQRPWPSRSFS
jgi:hypothetical protein